MVYITGQGKTLGTLGRRLVKTTNGATWPEKCESIMARGLCSVQARHGFTLDIQRPPQSNSYGRQPSTPPRGFPATFMVQSAHYDCQKRPNLLFRSGISACLIA